MEFSIRKAERKDCIRIMELVRELALFEKAPEQVTVTQEHFEESGFGDNPVWWGYVAEHEGNIVAAAIYYIRYSTWKGQRMYLEDIIVNEAYRGKGIGTMLFEKLIEEAKEKKFTGMMWQALDWNTPALDFYKKFGASFDEGWVNCHLDF